MIIIACIKQVPDTTQVKIDPVTNTLVREGVPFIINPFDAHALEESLRLKDKYGFKVAAISMGPPSTETILRKACALGADDAVLLSDRLFAGADTLATSNVLSAAIKKISEEDEVGIVFCGKQTIDGDTAQVGPGIATRLNYTQLTLVDKIISVDVEKKKIVVRRKLEGRHEIVEASLPAMITVVREINHPRYPKVSKRLESEKIAIKMWNNKVLNLEQSKIGLKGSPTCVSKIFSPQNEKGEIIGDGLNNPEEAAELLIQKLIKKEILSF